MTPKPQANTLDDEKKKLEATMAKAERLAHNFAKSMADHPNGCLYCEPQANTPKNCVSQNDIPNKDVKIVDNTLDEIDVTLWAKLSAESMIPRHKGEFIFYESDLLRIVKALITEARIDEVENLIKAHSRTLKQTVTDNTGRVSSRDSHAFISRYEAQERLAQLKENK